jgi:hypothetical protein
MNYTFWYGGSPDMEWLLNALNKLKTDEWTDPLYFDGRGFVDSVREAAAISLLDALRKNTSARSFLLHDADLELKAEKALEDAFRENLYLSSISMRNVRFQGRPMHVPMSLLKNKALQELNLENCAFDNVGWWALGRSVRYLTSLTLTGVLLPSKNRDQGISALAFALAGSDSLCSLALQGIELTPQEMNILLRAIGENRSLKVVRLERMSLGPENAASIASMLASNHTLVELSLRHNDLNGDALELAVEGLETNQTLETLLLSHNPVGDDGAKYLCQALQVNKSLRKLCLIQSEIWDEGILAITQGLGRFHSLERLHLDGNNKVDASIMLASLEQNVRVHHVLDTLPQLIQDDPQAHEWKKIDLLLRMNKAKRRVLIEQNVPAGVLPLILSGANSQQDVLYELLRQMPNTPYIPQ